MQSRTSPEFERQIAALHRKHIPVMEIRGMDGKGILDLTDEEIDVVEKKLAAGNISISAIGSTIGKIGVEDDFAPHFEKFKRAVEIAKKLHTTRIRMFSFYIPEAKESGNLSRYRDRANTENGGLRRSKWRTLLPRE